MDGGSIVPDSRAGGATIVGDAGTLRPVGDGIFSPVLVGALAGKLRTCQKNKALSFIATP